MTRSRTAFPLALSLALAALPACNSSRPTGAGGAALPRVAFVSNNPETFWNICEAGCRKAEAEARVEVLFRKPESGDAAKQKEIIDSLLGQDIKAISISVIDPKNQTAYLDQVASKVALITVDNDAPDSKRLCYLGTNNYEAGRAAGQLVKQALPEGGTIAIFVGQLEALNARQRRQGVLDELAGRPAPADINAVANTPDGETYGKYRLHKTYTDQPVGGAKAKENAADALSQLAGEPNLCFVGLWAYNPPAILSAVKDQNRVGKVKIVGFDENWDTLQGVEDGSIFATVVQDPFNFGYESVKLMAEVAKTGKLPADAPTVRYIRHRVVTKEGGHGTVAVGPFRDELRKNIGKTQR